MSRYAPARSQPRAPRVDREKTCPSLLRVFVNPLHHHPDSAFTVSSVPTAQEYQVYVWRDSTPREIVLSLRDAAPHLRSNPAARFSLKLVFWDPKDERFTSKELALINARDLGVPSSRGPPGGGGGGAAAVDRTLSESKYVIGDFIDVAYILPGVPNVVASGSVVNSSHSANGPQFAPTSSANGPRGNVGGFGVRGVAGSGPRNPRGDTWAPARPGPNGPLSRGGPGGGGGSGRGAPPADQGWGNRRPRTNAGPEDRFASTGSRQPRRNSRSLSPEQTRQSRPRPRSPSRSRSRSPPPPRRRSRSRSFSPGPAKSKSARERSGSPSNRRATPPHMKEKSGGGKGDQDEEMKD
ncbi:SAP18 family protein [Sporobolomyces salmoneus]|uniref:SAP18 family protein n=1 Tax=Sporobolomyces salmoneus TaxID=183962 RepID=UPI00316EDF7A